MMYDLFLSWYIVKARKQVIRSVGNFISKETIVKNSHIIRNMGTRGPIAKGSQLYDMNEIIHGYVVSVILTKFRINANI